MTRRGALLALALLTWFAGGCSSNPHQRNTTTINVAAIIFPGGGAPPAALSLLKAALEVSKAAGSEYDLKVVTISPSIDNLKPNQPDGYSPVAMALEQALSQDPEPDVVLFNSPNEFSGTVSKELLADLDPYIRADKAMPKEDYYPGALEAVTDNGRIYGIPVNGGPMVLQYDRRVFEAAGLNGVPENWTWSQFLDIARALTKNTGDPKTDQFAINQMMGPNIVPAFIWQNGGELLSKDGRRAMLGDAPALEAIKFVYDLTYSYRLSPAAIRAGTDGSMVKVAVPAVRTAPGEAPPLIGPGGRVAMNVVSNAAVHYGFRTAREDHPLRFAELPRGKNAATILDLQTVVAVTARARNPRLAYKVAATLVGEMQKELPIPTRRSAAKNLRRINSTISEDDARVLLNSMEYARPMPLNGDQRFLRPFYEKLVSPLQSSAKKPEEAVKDAVDAINQALNE